MFFRSIALVRSETITVGFIVVSPSPSSSATASFHRTLPERAFRMNRARRATPSRALRRKSKKKEKKKCRIREQKQEEERETEQIARLRNVDAEVERLLVRTPAVCRVKLEVEYSRRAFRRYT